MGQPVARLGDFSVGHTCYPNVTNYEASVDVFVENRRVHRNGDAWYPHTCSISGTHAGITNGGSTTVFVNGQGCGYVGASISCGDYILTGATTVFVGS